MVLPTVLGELQTGLYLIYTVDNTNVVPPETPDITPPAGNPGDIIPENVPAKVIYAMKEISLHTTANFTNDNIVMTYVKKPRIYRPRFMATSTRFVTAKTDCAIWYATSILRVIPTG